MIDALARLSGDLRATAIQYRPSLFPYKRFAFTLALAWVGGWVFSLLSLPLPWMLGPLAICTVASLLAAPVIAPAVVRPPVTMVIGVMLGSSFSPHVFTHLSSWVPTLIGLVFFVLICAAVTISYFRFVAGYDPATAFFSGMPGGFVEMILFGEEEGADISTIAIVHSARILLVVFSLPFLVAFLEGHALGRRPPVGVSILDAPADSMVWLVLCCILGALLGRWLKMPAKYLLGPTLVSAAVHAAGLSTSRPPLEIVITAQIMFGAIIGCRFAGRKASVILKVLGQSVGASLVMLVVTFAFASVVSRMSSYLPQAILLAYSPGGFAEMSLIALALNMEVAFVVGHHFVRIIFVVLIARPLYRFSRHPFGGADP